MTEASDKLALCISRAAFLHENSWSEEDCDYRMPLGAACREACAQLGEPDLFDVLVILLDHYWNDAIEWAFETSEKTTEED